MPRCRLVVHNSPVLVDEGIECQSVLPACAIENVQAIGLIIPIPHRRGVRACALHVDMMV